MATKASLNTDLPGDEKKWNVWADRHDVSNSTIHDATLTSASTINEKQYLLLQVLWTSGSGQELSLVSRGRRVLKQVLSRLHVSQDRHQIFITFAEYDSRYIQYLNNTLPPKSPRPFLKMHEFGPWNTMDRGELENIGGILLAIALRAYSDANLGKAFTNKQKSG
ncbi:uncharacterized protein PGRI_010420 [Penicillium griseofulvum]|uniref:Uncharacterized protein n=1 Tax=Penicillium patulum TaxID=5078 RepID=A0A135LYE1_PENPA|nr:uncharacterized protein PGRI_010420 [Penicillium griseofulvum]KXG53992.1 hypothetical protein PGRI_010420 [Penicillium griseofulvum]